MYHANSGRATSLKACRASGAGHSAGRRPSVQAASSSLVPVQQRSVDTECTTQSLHWRLRRSIRPSAGNLGDRAPQARHRIRRPVRIVWVSQSPQPLHPPAGRPLLLGTLAGVQAVEDGAVVVRVFVAKDLVALRPADAVESNMNLEVILFSHRGGPDGLGLQRLQPPGSAVSASRDQG